MSSLQHARQCDPIVTSLAKMCALLQSQLAAEAMEEVLTSNALLAMLPQNNDAPSLRETGIEMELYKHPDSHYNFSRHKK